jgi:PAS domain S-box-containing protein
VPTTFLAGDDVELRERTEAYELLRALVDHVPAMLAYWDSSQRCRLANKAYETWFGVRPEQLIGREMRELLGPIYPKNLPYILGALRGEEQMFEREIPDPKGGPPRYSQAHYIPDVHDGVVRGFFVLVANITDRRRAEEATRQAEHELRVAIENAPVGMALASLTGRWQLVNRVLCELLGYSNEELQALTFQKVTHPDDLDLDVEQMESLLRGERSRYSVQKRYIRKDGSVVDVVRHVALIRSESGQPDHFIVQVEDLTERKQLQQKLMLADRLASAGALAGGVAHEVNNPLACVIANLETIDAEIRGSGAGARSEAVPRLLELIGEAREGAERVRKIVRDLHLFARGGAERRVAIDVVEVMEAALRLTANEIRHRARVVRELASVPPVEGDAGQLSQVFIKLLMNAVQALPEGRADAHLVTVRTHTDARGRAVVEVQDTGRGIAADELEHIFEPFFTTRAVGQGPGLGLSVVHGIVSSMGGEIAAESAIGAGTTIRMILPPARAAAAAKEAPPPPAPTPVAPAAPAGRPRVLVVDDDVMVGRVVGRVLQEENDVTVVTSGETALETLSRERFDVIVSDLMMPQMTGMDLHAALRERSPDQAERMLFMTGGAFTRAAREFLESVASLWIEKPINSNTLRELVRRLASRPRP